LSDTASSPKATPAVAFCFLLNQLLDRERWARDRLVPYVGQALEIRPPVLPPLRLAIGAGGRIEPGGPEPAALITLEGVSGETPLAEEVRYLARHLRWDAEEELSRIVGDVAAERLVGTARAFVRWQRDAALRVGEALADYATQESGALVRRGELAQLGADIARFAAVLEQLEQRVSRLA
jgi:ubiquinone biosynthesis protein UbiJ